MDTRTTSDEPPPEAAAAEADDDGRSSAHLHAISIDQCLNCFTGRLWREPGE